MTLRNVTYKKRLKKIINIDIINIVAKGAR